MSMYCTPNMQSLVSVMMQAMQLLHTGIIPYITFCDIVACSLQNVQMLRTEGLPAVFAQWTRAPADAPTLLIYGHYGNSSIDLCCKHDEGGT